MRIAVVCGDGLPVSGLLTILRNVLMLDAAQRVLEFPIDVDLGFSWRPDKGNYYPRGLRDAEYPAWMRVSTVVPQLGVGGDRAVILRETKRLVANESAITSDDVQVRLDEYITAMRKAYCDHFLKWLRHYQISLVMAINLTLSDAVGVRQGLQMATDEYAEERGDLVTVYWDHDLFASCAIIDPKTGEREYPETPNTFTPLPRDDGRTRWVVVSQSLADEAARYGAELGVDIYPNVLPDVSKASSDEYINRHLSRLGISPGRRIVINPVRLFHVKGVHLAVQVLAHMRRLAVESGDPEPALVVFGGLEEDVAYATRVLSLVKELELEDHVVFADGVPLTSDFSGASTRLDEIDWLRAAQMSGGGVVFTPDPADVETVGLGPALAAIAGMPVLRTEYAVFESIYGRDFESIVLNPPYDAAEFERAAVRFWEALKTRSPDDLRRLETNAEVCFAQFDATKWSGFWDELPWTRPAYG